MIDMSLQVIKTPSRKNKCPLAVSSVLVVFCLQCQNASGILWSHGMSREGGVTLADFSFLCPALLRQIDGGACVVHRAADPPRGTGALFE